MNDSTYVYIIYIIHRHWLFKFIIKICWNKIKYVCIILLGVHQCWKNIIREENFNTYIVKPGFCTLQRYASSRCYAKEISPPSKNVYWMMDCGIFEDFLLFCWGYCSTTSVGHSKKNTFLCLLTFCLMIYMIYYLKANIRVYTIPTAWTFYFFISNYWMNESLFIYEVLNGWYSSNRISMFIFKNVIDYLLNYFLWKLALKEFKVKLLFLIHYALIFIHIALNTDDF